MHWPPEATEGLFHVTIFLRGALVHLTGSFIDTSERPVPPVRQASFLNQGYKLCQTLGQWLSTLAAHCHLGRELKKLMPGSHTKDSDVMLGWVERGQNSNQL